MHAVRFNAVRAHRLKRAEADVQGERGDACATAAQPIEHLLVEVQACGGRRHGARVRSVNGLIALEVLAAGRVRDVGR